MKEYNVDEAFALLKEYKITSSKESVRRWLRTGVIKGIKPRTRKEGWRITKDNLYVFIHARMPHDILTKHSNEKDNVKKEDKETIRSEMWWEITRKFMFEGFIEPKKRQVQECIQHKRYSIEFEKYVWKHISAHKQGYSAPRIPYLLDAFLFDNERILMDKNYESLEEKIIYALIEYLRKNRANK